MIKINYLFKTIALCSLFFLFSCSKPQPFKLALMPDTQTYSRLYPEVFRSQTEWIAANADSFAFVLQQGDVTDNNIDAQWKVAVEAMSLLDGIVPYTIAMGNHDLGTRGSTDTRNSDLFNHYFPYSKYSKQKGFGGAYETGKIDNTWHTFHAGGIDWLILSLEFGPRNCVLDWAADVVQQHSRHKIIINTHAYMYSDDTRMGEGDKWLPQSYGIGKDTCANAVNNGEQIWDKLVSRYTNILFVFSGHVLHDGVGTLVSEGIHGNKVYQMLANYQHGVDGIHGDEGYFRILTIDPAKHTVDVKTYSPHLKKYKTEPDQQFVFQNVSF
ncbi:MAG: metallophosphatase [Bacteroidales bacterium]|nr:metallophosphatase [Bacteroidales bacterium]